jgi:hypothetical protein
MEIVPKYADPTAKPWNRIARPEETEKWAPRHTETLDEGVQPKGVDVQDQGLVPWFIRGWHRGFLAAAFCSERGEDTVADEKPDVRPASDFAMPVSKTPRGDNMKRKKLRNLPFTLDTFRLVSKRMSAHSWIGRLISRANVPAFERTLTEMPLYTSTGDSMVRQKAISEWICGLLSRDLC